MATGSITAKFTKGGAHSSQIYTSRVENFLSGTVTLGNNDTSPRAVTLYGLNLESLRGLPGLDIIGIKISIYCGSYTSSGNTSYLKFRLVKDFDTDISNTDTSIYTDFGDGSITVFEGYNKAKTYELTQDYFPNAFQAIRSDIGAFLNGFSQNTFGFRLYFAYANLYSLEVTVDYSYTEPITVTVNASPAEGGTVTGGGTYESGSTVTATAVPNRGYTFSHWLINGADSGVTTPTISGALTEDTTVTAVFSEIATSKVYCGTQKVSVYCGTQRVSVYCGTKKLT